MSLFDRTNSVSKEGPNAILPPAQKQPFFRRRAEEPPPRQSPSSLLPEASDETHARSKDDVVAVSPSTLLPKAAGAEQPTAQDDVVAVSPSELFPPAPVRPLLDTRRLIILGSVLLVIAALALLPLVRELAAPTPAALIEQAKQLREKGNFVAAVIQLNNVLQQEPENAEGRYLLGRSQLALGNALNAEEELRRAISSGWDKFDVYPDLAAAMLRQGKFQQLLDEIRPQDADRSSNPAQTNTTRGLAQLALGNEAEARIAFDKSLSQSPGNTDALLGLARLAARGKRLDEAERLIDDALRTDGRSVDALLLKAELQLAAKRPAEALKAYQALLSIYPENVTANLHLAARRLDENDLNGALPHVQTALKGAPRHPQALLMRALIAHRKNDPRTARAAIIDAIRANENDPAIQLLAGAIFYAQGHYDEAQRPLLKLLEKNPTHSAARKLYAAALMRTGQTHRATEVLLPTQRLIPNDPALLTLIGDAFARSSDYKNSHAFLVKSLQGRASITPKPYSANTILYDIDAALAPDTSEQRTKTLLAATLVRLGRFDEAHLILGELDVDRKQDSFLLMLKGAALLGQADLVGARSALETALALDPYNVGAAYNLAHVDLREGDPPNARKRLQRILSRQPNNAIALMAMAMLGPSVGATNEEIVGWLEQARASKGGGPQVLMALAQHHLRKNENAQALALAREAHALAKHDPEVLRLLGAVQMATGEAAEAINTYSQLLAMNPGSTEAARMLAKAQLANNNAASAGVLLRKILETNPHDPEALTDLGIVELRAGRFDSALEIARSAQRLAPADSRPFVVEGDTLMSQGKATLAAAAYENALQRQRSSDLAIRMHFALDQLGRGREADSALRSWISETPEDPAARSYFGLYLLERGKYQEAAQEFEALVNRHPKRADALNNLAWALHKQRFNKRALGYAERAFELRPNDAAVLDTLGTILIEEGNYERGIELLRRAVTLAPDVPEARFNLVQAWITTGNRPSARRELELLSSSYPNFRRKEVQALAQDLRR